MKKYKLKKDLPLEKTGTEVYLVKYAYDNKKCSIIKTNNRYRICDIHIDKINEWLEEIPEKPKSVFEIKEGDKYYYINSWGEIFGIILKGEFCDNDRLEIGNVFLTKEEAEKELEKRKAIQKIKKYCWENGIETEYIIGEKENSFFYHDYDDEIEFEATYKNGNPLGHFSFKDAEKILEKFEEELKIILDV